MGRPRRDPTIEDQLRTVITQALKECRNELAKQLIDVLDGQQKSLTNGILKEIQERKE